jgi:hypothetical protein
MVWPILALTGFLVLTALVIALGTRSTRRYEWAQQDQAGAAPPASRPVGGGRTT